MIAIERFYRFGVLAAVCGALLSGCSSPVEPAPDGLVGVWEWVRAEGGIAGVTLTPETEGFTRQLRITRPDRIQLERNGVVEVVTRFELIRSSFPQRAKGTVLRGSLRGARCPARVTPESDEPLLR